MRLLICWRRKKRCWRTKTAAELERAKELADAECAPHWEHLPVWACRGNRGHAPSPSLLLVRARIWQRPLRPWEHHAWCRHGPRNIDSSSFLGHSSRSPACFPVSSGSLQEVTPRLGNECYKKGRYAEALRHYERAVALCPESAACRGNQAAALMGLGRLADALRECMEAVRFDLVSGRAHSQAAALMGLGRVADALREFEEAVRFDPVSVRSHSHVAGVCLRLGMIDKERRHFTQAGHLQQSDPAEWQKLQEVEVHLGRCTDARKIGDWKSTLRRADAAIAAGADSSQLLLALRSEALLHLHKLEEADSTLASMLKLDGAVPSLLAAAKISGMLAESYVHIVRAQDDMALGRFDTVVAAAENGRDLDPGNAEIGMV